MKDTEQLSCVSMVPCHFCFQGVAKMLKKLPIFLKTGTSLLISYYNEDLFMTKNISQLGFDGYKEPLIDFVQTHTPIKILPNAIFGLFHEVIIRSS